MRAGIAQIDPGSLAAMLCQNWAKATINFHKGFGKAGGLEFAVALDQRRLQAVRIHMQIANRHALGADIALAEDIILIANDRFDGRAADFQFQPAAGFAKRTYFMGEP